MIRYYFKYIPWLFIGFIICNIFADFEFMYTKKGKIVPGTYKETNLIVDNNGEQLKFIGCNFVYINKKGNKVIIDDNDKIQKYSTYCSICGNFHNEHGNDTNKYTFKIKNNEIDSVIYNKLKEGYVVKKPILLTNIMLFIYTIIVMMIMSMIADMINNTKRGTPGGFVSAGLYCCPMYNIICHNCCCKEEREETLKTKLKFLGYDPNKVNEYLNFVNSNNLHDKYSTSKELYYMYTTGSFKRYLKWNQK